jgi:hypothetical protein
MTTTVSNLKKGQRFYFGMWYDFVGSISFGDCVKMTVTNGYDNREFYVIAKPSDNVLLSKNNS